MVEGRFPSWPDPTDAMEGHGWEKQMDATERVPPCAMRIESPEAAF